MAPDDRCCPGSSVMRVGIICLVGLGILAAAQMADKNKSTTKAATLAEASPVVLKADGKYVVSLGRSTPAARNLEGDLTVELVGADGTVQVTTEKELVPAAEITSDRIEMKAPSAEAEKLTLRLRLGKQKLEKPLASVLVVQGHETSLTAGQEYHSGSAAGLRCEVHGVKSLTETLPLTGADVEVALRGPDHKWATLYKGKSGRDGVAAVEFKMPAIPPGTYAMLVTTRSDFGEQKLESQVKVKAESKVLLTTDKPLYQPGQVMHIRALTLRPFDLTPVAGEEMTFEIEDGKGNKVFKKSQKTSEHGITNVDFTLADEVNMGDYQIRAVLGPVTAQKTVAVKKYVLPKFKTEVTADKRYYAPKETIHADIQSDYFFGKPVAGGTIKVKASTFDVQFKDFLSLDLKTDANGHAKIDVALPDYFVGTPLAKGDAVVKLEIKVTDLAEHTETITKTYTVSDQAIRVSLIPEGGRLVPDMDNRVFAAALYPDGSPAKCLVKLWLGQRADGAEFAALQTNDAGLAEFTIKPTVKQFRQADMVQKHVEMLGGNAPALWQPRQLLDMTAIARDDKGNMGRAVSEVNADAHGENVILRLDKGIYQGGDTVKADIRTSAGMPTVYLDVVRNGQTMLTRWIDVKDGKAEQKLELPPNVFGTLEVHAYQVLASGEIVRDSRVVYVHPRDDLKIEVTADKKEYAPGADGKITFRVTDSSGKPTQAALGVIIVDEAVYALQEMQPGLEKVFFTLQEELLKPQAQVSYQPHDSINDLVRDGAVPANKQQIAQALLAPIKPKMPARWEVAPQVGRQRQAEDTIDLIGSVLLQYAAEGKDVLKYDAESGKLSFKPGLFDELVKAQRIAKEQMHDPFGASLTLESIVKLEPQFTASNLAAALTHQRQQQLTWMLVNYSQNNQAKFLKKDHWEFPETVLDDAVADAIKNNPNNPEYHKQIKSWLKDMWGTPFRLVKAEKKREHQMGWTQFDFHEIVSAGPDRKFGTDDDVHALNANDWRLSAYWWLGDAAALQRQIAHQAKMPRAGFGRRDLARRLGEMDERLQKFEEFDKKAAGFNKDVGNFPPPVPAGIPGMPRKPTDLAGTGGAAQGENGGSAPPIRVREYFPETLLWQPALITDENGIAHLPVNFADSITTWRLSASASSRHGLLGGASAGLRVFQDFFVDIDLPVALTQNDEVAFPVAVFNYLKNDQTVQLELEKGDWFELMDSQGYTRSLDLKPGEVTAVRFRIKAKRVGSQPLTVKARGTKLSDAMKRSIEVLPNGKAVEQVFADRLGGKVTQKVMIPENAIPDASKLMVKIYPGVMSQVLEGAEGMIRLPGG